MAIEQDDMDMTEHGAGEAIPRRATSEFWLTEISAAMKRESDWRREAAATLKRYTLEGTSGGGLGSGTGKFNILWSNTEMLRNAIYNQPPVPDVRQRWDNDDPLALGVAQALNRSLTYAIERGGLDIVARRAVLDYLLPGRAILRVRYVPEFTQEMTETGEVMEQLADERIGFENVSWNDFCHDDAKTWERVDWVAFRHYMTRDEAKEAFPDTWRGMSFTDARGGADDDTDGYMPGGLVDTQAGVDNLTALVWEVWDRKRRRVLWVSRGADTGPQGGVLLDTEPPLDLEGFYPIARPLYAIDQPASLIPMPFYSQYREQAAELDAISARIRKMVRVIKWRGLYDASMGGDIARLLNEGDDGQLVPTDLAQQWAEGGGIAGAIWTMPLGEASAALTKLYESREQTKAVIFEITGISDILRGTSDPRETASAQAIKAQWGTSRIDGMKREVQRFFRDTLAIAAEVIGETFQASTIAQMTGLPFPTQGQKLAAQALLDRTQGGAEQVDEGTIAKAKQVLESPSWEDVINALHSDKARAFKVDIETDSTIAPDQRREMDSLSQSMEMLGSLLSQVVPGLEKGLIPQDMALALVGAVIRKTPLANDMSSILQKYEGQLESGANPLEGKLQAAEARAAELEKALADKQAELELKALDIQEKKQRLQSRDAINAMDIKLRERELAARTAMRPPLY